MKIPTLLSLIAATSLATASLASAEEQSATPAVPTPGAPAPGKPHCPMGFRKDFGKFRNGPGGFAHQPGKGGFEWGQMLQLTPDQKAKVQAIMEAQKPKIQAIREEESAKIKAVFDDVDKQIRPLLTAEQIAVLDNAKKLRESATALRKSQADTSAAPVKK